MAKGKKRTLSRADACNILRAVFFCQFVVSIAGSAALVAYDVACKDKTAVDFPLPEGFLS